VSTVARWARICIVGLAIHGVTGFYPGVVCAESPTTLALSYPDRIGDLSVFERREVGGVGKCAPYQEDELCISWNASNRSGTTHHPLWGVCLYSNGGMSGPIEEGTELSIAMQRGSVEDLAFYLQCELKLEGDVEPNSNVEGLMFENLRWEGLLGHQPAGPLLTVENREIWIVVKDHGSKLKLVGKRTTRK